MEITEDFRFISDDELYRRLNLMCDPEARFSDILDAMDAKTREMFLLIEELKKRKEDERMNIQPLLNDDRTYEYMKPILSGLDHEEVWIICLDNSLYPISRKMMSKGSKNASLIDVTEIMREAVRNNATGIILIHNHPSGKKMASAQDVCMISKLNKACEVCEVKLLSSIIFTENGFGKIEF